MDDEEYEPSPMRSTAIDPRVKGLFRGVVVDEGVAVDDFVIAAVREAVGVPVSVGTGVPVGDAEAVTDDDDVIVCVLVTAPVAVVLGDGVSVFVLVDDAPVVCEADPDAVSDGVVGGETLDEGDAELEMDDDIDEDSVMVAVPVLDRVVVGDGRAGDRARPRYSDWPLPIAGATTTGVFESHDREEAEKAYTPRVPLI